MDEDKNEDKLKLESKSSNRSGTNESALKQPGSQVTLTMRSGGSGTILRLSIASDLGFRGC